MVSPPPRNAPREMPSGSNVLDPAHRSRPGPRSPHTSTAAFTAGPARWAPASHHPSRRAAAAPGSAVRALRTRDAIRKLLAPSVNRRASPARHFSTAQRRAHRAGQRGGRAAPRRARRRLQAPRRGRAVVDGTVRWRRRRPSRTSAPPCPPPGPPSPIPRWGRSCWRARRRPRSRAGRTHREPREPPSASRRRAFDDHRRLAPGLDT